MLEPSPSHARAHGLALCMHFVRSRSQVQFGIARLRTSSHISYHIRDVIVALHLREVARTEVPALARLSNCNFKLRRACYGKSAWCLPSFNIQYLADELSPVFCPPSLPLLRLIPTHRHVRPVPLILVGTVDGSACVCHGQMVHGS